MSKTICFQKFVDNAQQYLALHHKPRIWIFTEGEGDGIKSRIPFKIFSTLSSINLCPTGRKRIYHGLRAYRPKYLYILWFMSRMALTVRTIDERKIWLLSPTFKLKDENSIILLHPKLTD